MQVTLDIPDSLAEQLHATGSLRLKAIGLEVPLTEVFSILDTK